MFVYYRELFTALYDYPKFGTPFKRGDRYDSNAFAYSTTHMSTKARNSRLIPGIFIL